jgi:hypothetical protein
MVEPDYQVVEHGQVTPLGVLKARYLIFKMVTEERAHANAPKAAIRSAGNTASV